MEDIASFVSRVLHVDYGNSHPVMPEQSWWGNLQSNFSKNPDGFELDLRTRLLVNSTAYADIGTRTLMATLLATVCLPLMFNPTKDKAIISRFRGPSYIPCQPRVEALLGYWFKQSANHPSTAV